MRRAEEMPIDPDVAAALDAIDAALAGAPVAAEHAELAELAVLTASCRPQIDPDFARSLDQRVESQFSRQSAAPFRGSSRTSWLRPLAFVGTAAVVLVVAIVTISSSGSSPRPLVEDLAKRPASTVARPTSTAPLGGASTSSTTAAAGVPKPADAGQGPVRSSSAASGATAVPSNAASVPYTAAAASPRPVPNGRKIVQSAQLSLDAAPANIDTVAQELFNVVGRENGYVNSSSVTAGAGGYAQFQLSVPSSALADTMTALSQLHDASVVSRTDAAQDVNGEYLYDTRKLADDRALRTSLLRQLGKATTQEQIDSLNARIRDAEASIRSDEATLRGLNHRISYSQVVVTINGVAAVPGHHSSGTFTLGKAAHDAGRLLTVLAGVSLIALAAILPLALLVAVTWWVASILRRRSREHALDVA